MHTRSFDPNGRLKTHRVGSDTRTLTYDAASRITQTTDTNPAYNRTYDYDELDRLISQSVNSGFKLWGYDANSNRTTAQFGGTGYPYTIASTSNRLTSAAGPVAKNYSYDAAGNPLSDGATTFTWNAAGKLATTVNNAKTHTYKTNALDQRISKNGSLSSKFFFFYDPAGQLIGEYRDNASTATPTDDWLVRQETIWLEDIPVAIIRKATATSPILVYFIHADHLNTPRVLVNQSNTPIWRWDNTHAFGANLPNEDPDGNGQLFEYHPRFPGQYFDKETGLHYNYFRYYEPETGRYISPDPVGLAGGVNVWGYVSGNPLLYIDPYGLYNLNDFIADADNFRQGSISYFRGIYRTGKFAARHTGLLGKCEQQKAQKEGIIFAGVTDQLLNNSNFRDQVARAIKDYADNNRAYVVGRGSTGFLISSGLTRTSGAYGSMLGIALPIAAVTGDIRSAIESGAHSSQAIAAAIAGGEARNLPDSGSTGCGC